MDCMIQNGAKIRVLGVGGAGGNAINNMIAAGLDGVDFIAANTDFQALERSLAGNKVQLGVNLTRGLGAGGKPETGAKATEENIDQIREMLQDSDMVFIAAGLGGGTGTGGAPIIAQACKELGALTVAIVTRPFRSEMKVRTDNADNGLKALRSVVDTLITIPNDRLVALADRRATLLDMFKKADDILLDAVKGITELITRPGIINVDFADVKTVMSEMGMALMGTGVGRGENRAVEAAQQAISSPLLEDVSIRGARAALVNICANQDLGMMEFEEISNIVTKEIDDDNVNIILGTAIDDSFDDELRVTVIATGIGNHEEKLKPKSGVRFGSIPRVPVNPGPTYEIPEAGRRLKRPPIEPREAEAPPKRKSFFTRLAKSKMDEDDWNIPTFIRKQVD